jgi:transcriptional regulator with XRE-family HTH domain
MIDATDLITRHRRAAGLSQRELARRAGTSSATLHRYEKGLVDPTTGTLNRILRACLPRRRRWGSASELGHALVRELRAGDKASAWRFVAEFLDDDQGADDSEFALVVADAPMQEGEPRADALVAALVEYLSTNRGLVPPSWTQPALEVVPWWFVAGERFHALALRESPPSFARRGIFVTNGALERV